MRIRLAVAWMWTPVVVACCPASPAAALDRPMLQNLFVAPYSVGERDGDLPIWPIFKQTSRGDALIAYVFDYADFASVPVGADEGIHRLVAVRPSGAFLEARLVRAEKPGFFGWFGRAPEFDFIRRDRAGELTPAPSALGGIAGSRDYVRARLGLAPGEEAPAAPAPVPNVHWAAFMIGISAFVAVLIRRRASILAGARAGLRRFGAGRILPAMETPE